VLLSLSSFLLLAHLTIAVIAIAAN